jgi:hypothetical protein
MSEQDNGAEATISDETQLDTLREGIDDPQVLKAQLAAEAEARRQLTARAKTAEAEKKAALAELADLKGKNTTVTTESTISSSTTDTDKVWEVADLISKGYNKQDAEFIEKNGGKAALADPNSYTSIALKAMMEQRTAERAATQTDQSGGEDSFLAVNFNLPKNPTTADLKKSIADMEKALPHAD